MQCPHCQAPNAESARFCGACGKATSSTEPVSDPNLGPAPQLIGRVIAGRYRILSKIGEGGMGAVFQAEQISLKRTVAIKLLRPDVSASPLILRRFNAEAEAVAKLRHPNTVNIYDFGQDTDGTLFIAMELIEGRSLRTVVHHEAPLPVRRALSIAAQVAASLADAHAKTIIHRDLKPDNVMLSDRGRSKDNVTVLDFGIAKLRDDSRGTQQQMTQAGDMLGTPQYMAPEQIRGEQIDGRTDIYALGCMIYEMVTARQPYEATSVMALLSKHLLEQAPPPSQRRPELGLPPALDELVVSSMAKDPASRAPTMEDFGERIAALLATLPAEASAQHSAVVGVPGYDTPPAYSAFGAGFAPTSPPPGGPPSGPPTPAPPPGAPTPPPAYGAPQVAGGYPPPPQQQPYGYPPGPHALGPHAPYPSPPRPSSGTGSLWMWLLAGVLILGAGGAAIYFATRGKPAQVADKDKEPAKPDPDEDTPDKPGPSPDRDPDKWDKPTPPDPDDETPSDDTVDDDPSVAGKRVDVGQGVKIIALPGMQVQRVQDGYVIGDLASLAIIAGPIDIPSNDLDVLARDYAKRNNLKLMNSELLMVAGTTRKVFAFQGNFNGGQVAQVGLPLLGTDYRMAVIIHMTAAYVQANADKLEAQVKEILAHRILVPSS